MAIINCPECRKKISSTVNVCPHCGFTITKEEVNRAFKSKNNRNLSCVIIIGAIGLLMYVFIRLGYKPTEVAPATKDSVVEVQLTEKHLAYIIQLTANRDIRIDYDNSSLYVTPRHWNNIDFEEKYYLCWIVFHRIKERDKGTWSLSVYDKMTNKRLGDFHPQRGLNLK